MKRKIPVPIPHIEWFASDPERRERGVALVIHGLNLNPKRMRPLIRHLTSQGIRVLNVFLSGHSDQYSENAERQRLRDMKKVTYQLWFQEVFEAYQDAKDYGAFQNLPIYLVGYSLGGLMGVALQASQKEVSFEKMVLFAPALSLHKSSYFLKVLSPLPRLMIPSVAPSSYRANGGTSMAAYNALYRGISRLKTKRPLSQDFPDTLNVPTLVCIDPKDELVSYRGIQQFIQTSQLDQWQLHEVHKGSDGKYYRHLIIDPVTVGKQEWSRLMHVMTQHLLDESQEYETIPF